VRCGRLIKVYLGQRYRRSGGGQVGQNLSRAGEARAGTDSEFMHFSLEIVESKCYAAIQEPWSSHQALSTLGPSARASLTPILKSSSSQCISNKNARHQSTKHPSFFSSQSPRIVHSAPAFITQSSIFSSSYPWGSAAAHPGYRQTCGSDRYSTRAAEQATQPPAAQCQAGAEAPRGQDS
jgi:hypothetical protein